MLYVQYGCGLSCPDGWINFDASPTLLLQKLPLIGFFFTLKADIVFSKKVRFGDIVKGLPVVKESAAGVYCSHVLEHLALEDFRLALKNTHSMLIRDGVFRFVLPDLEFLVNKYLNSKSSDASINFMRETYLGKKTRNRSLTGFIREWLGNSHHLWMWDFKSISAELSHAGFKDIRRVSIGDSTDVKFSQVESPDRWLNCLGIECRKS